MLTPLPSPLRQVGGGASQGMMECITTSLAREGAMPLLRGSLWYTLKIMPHAMVRPPTASRASLRLPPAQYGAGPDCGVAGHPCQP